MSPEKQSSPLKRRLSYEPFTNKEEELDLVDLIAQLWRGKITIILTVAFTLVLSILYLNFAKEKWTSEAIVSQPSAGQVATFNDALSVLYTQNIEDKIALPDLQKQIFGRFSASAYALSGSLKNLADPLELKVEQFNKGKDDPITISFTTDSAKGAQEELQKYINQINTDVSNDFAIDMRSNISVKIAALKNSLTTQENVAEEKKNHRIDVINQAIKIAKASNITSTKLTQAEFLSDDTMYLLGTTALDSMVANESTKPLEFDDLYYQSKRTLFGLENLRIDFSKLQNFQYIKKADLPHYRDSPKKLLTLVLAIIFGCIIGACIVIGRNLSQNYRQKNKNSGN